MRHNHSPSGGNPKDRAEPNCLQVTPSQLKTLPSNGPNHSPHILTASHPGMLMGSSSRLGPQLAPKDLGPGGTFRERV